MEIKPDGILLDYSHHPDHAYIRKTGLIIDDAIARGDERLSTDPPSRTVADSIASLGGSPDIDIADLSLKTRIESLHVRASGRHHATSKQEIWLPTNEIVILDHMIDANIRNKPELINSRIYKLNAKTDKPNEFRALLTKFLKDTVTVK